VSYSIDVNVLLLASALEFLEGCATRAELLCMAWPTLLGYVRIATHGRIFEKPMSHEVAAANVSSLLALPSMRVIAEQEGFWDVYREVTASLTVRGKLVPDAHLVALLRQNGVRTLYTNDRDFRKFDGIDAIDPFQ
jgi:toxin-antitoxin system PIN domain toxin